MILLLLALSQATFMFPLPPAPSVSPGDRLAMARSQHEVLVLLVEKGRYDDVPAEFQKILDLHFEGRQEQLVVDEVLVISDLLARRGKQTVALKVADMALSALREKVSRARLFKEKGFIYKQMGQDDKAMAMFEKGRELE